MGRPRSETGPLMLHYMTLFNIFAQHIFKDFLSIILKVSTEGHLTDFSPYYQDVICTGEFRPSYQELCSGGEAV